MVLRLREPWEAVDLGFVLLRAHWKAVMLAWLAVAAPLTAALLALFWHQLWIPPLVVWWLKPLLDRFVLHVLARATFGEVPGLRDTFRRAPAVPPQGPAALLDLAQAEPPAQLRAAGLAAGGAAGPRATGSGAASCSGGGAPRPCA